MTTISSALTAALSAALFPLSLAVLLTVAAALPSEAAPQRHNLDRPFSGNELPCQPHSQHHQRLHASSRLQPHAHLNMQLEYVATESAASQPRIHCTTRLRRVMKRRMNAQRNSISGGGLAAVAHSEWGYQTSNDVRPASALSSGKTEDNPHDVEFIDSTAHTARPEFATRPLYPKLKPHPQHGYGYIPPPPLVPTSSPAAIMSDTVTTTMPSVLVTMHPSYATQTPPTFPTNETNTIRAKSHSINDPREMERRHICVQQRTITLPVKTREVYTRPMWKHVSAPCPMQTHVNQMCTRVQLVHERSFRDVIHHKSAQQVTYDCCSGWTRATPDADACLKRVCSARCQNSVQCRISDQCSCSAGFADNNCEHDINECKEEKPCDQTCINTVGSYFCKCREGFILQLDQQSCKKIELRDDDAFEARDLENEINTDGGGVDDNVSARLQKIERSLAKERVQTNELQKTLQVTYTVVDTLKNRLSTLEKQQHDLSRLQTNLDATETRTNKLEGLLNLLMKCRNAPSAHCQ